jgi:ribosomal-protein-alanine N-acetyltransferase
MEERMPVMETDRLIVRSWRDGDLVPFAALNADPQVTRYLPARLTRVQSDALATQIRARQAAQGFGYWALELKHGAPFIGFAGVNRAPFEARFTPAVEIGWRLAHEYWGRGYATEVATAVLAYGFAALGVPEIVSFTAPENCRSRAVMERLGMTRDPHGDFDHPSLPRGHRLSRHVLYRISRPSTSAD